MEAISVSYGKRRYDNIMRAVYGKPWAILPSMLAVIEEIVELRASGTTLSPQQIQARVSAAQNGPRNGAQGGSVAVIPIYGVLTKRAGLMSEMSGATSLEQLTADFRGALADPEVGAIVFDVDSPGGSVEGITELANEIRAARGRKPITAVADVTMASAAYWLASQADEVIAAPSSFVGSIGIIGAHVDVTAQDEMAGEKVTLITAGEGKDNGNEHKPLTDEAKAELQGMADDFYALFVADVAAARGVSASVVTDTWKAQIFTAQKALAAGLVDGIATLEGTVSRRVGEQQRQGITAAYSDPALVASGALAQMTATEQVEWMKAERERLGALLDKKAELRAKEGRAPQSIEQLRAALADVDTDQPEDATPTPKGRRAMQLEVAEAAFVGGYPQV
jgi:signal peptide peptidase SppA